MIKRTIFFVLSLLAAFGVCAEALNIDNAELARLAASGVPVIDIRTAGEWKESGVIPGSKLLTYFDEQGRSDPPAWLEKLRRFATADQPVILICRSGKRSARATHFLAQQAGYKTVYNASGGMNGWIQEGRSVVAPGDALAGCAAGSRC